MVEDLGPWFDVLRFAADGSLIEDNSAQTGEDGDNDE
jgi:hypothetical protein